MRKSLLYIFLAAGIGVIAIGPAPTSMTQTYSISGRILVKCRGNHDGVIVWTDQDHKTETDAQGDYEIAGLADGEFVVRAWSKNCLARIVDTIQISGAAVTGVNDTLFAGDVTEDGRINLLDAGAILAAYQATPDSAAWDAVLDIDGSGVIDSLDIAALMVHWKERSDSPLPPMDIVVTEPGANTTWYLGARDVPIYWETGNLGGEMSLSLFRGDELIEWIIYATPNDGSHTAFDVPTNLEPGTDYRVRVYYSQKYHAFSDYFEIRHYFDVTEPASSTVWYLNEQNVSIVWEDPGDLDGDVSIILYRDDVQAGVISNATPNDGSYTDYDVPPDLSPGFDYWVSVFHDGGHFGYSDRFEIRSDDIVVIEPDSATTWYLGARDVPTRWETGKLGGNVSIVFLRGNDKIATIASPTPNDGAYDEYDVPADLTPASNYRIWIHRDAGHYDYSDYFGVQPHFVISEPNAGTKWYLNQEDVPILWNPSNLDADVSISLYRGDSPVDTVTDGTQNDGSYTEYDVPSNLEPGSDYRVEVKNDSLGISNYSESFEILPYFIVTEPAGGTIWYLSQQNVPIRWEPRDLDADVSLDLYEGENPVDVISNGTPNDGAYDDYIVPPDLSPGTDYRVRVHYGESHSGFSGGFEIKTPIVITQPDSGSVWGLEQRNVPIYWDDGNLGGAVSIDLYKGVVQLRTIVSSTPNDGGYDDYDVPADLTPGTDYTVYLYFNEHHSDFSDPFEIVRQPVWHWQNPLPQGNHLYEVSFSDVNTGTAVGLLGTILRTTDGGDTWTMQAGDTDETLRGVFFTDTDTGTIVGHNGLIMQTTDGGDNWLDRASGTTEILRDVYFTDADTGTAVGDNCTILRTTDGGNTWIVQDNINGWCPSSFFSVSFANPARGVIVGIGGMGAFVQLTTNGGASWEQLNIVPWDWELLGVSLADTMIGAAVGGAYSYDWHIWSSVIEHTVDGGYTWSTSTYPVDQVRLRDVAFADAENGTAVGDGGHIVRTTDGGAKWVRQTSGTIYSLHGISLVDADTGTAVGDGGTILRTTDGGSTWTVQTRGVSLNHHLNGISFGDANTATAVGGAGTIVRTTDGGATWVEQTSNASKYTLGDVSFTSPDTGTVVGSWYEYIEAMEFFHGIILRTTDGGTTWVKQLEPMDRMFYGVHFIDSNHGMVVGRDGNSGVILRTADGGDTWVDLTTGTTPIIFKIFFTDINTGTGVGPGGVIVRTTDGGDTWVQQTSGTSIALCDVVFTDANTGTVVGNDGTVLRTTDGGATWIQQAIPASVDLYSVSFANENVGVIAGSGGSIFWTDNGGSRWLPLESGTKNSLYGVFFTDANTGTVVGTYGTILRTTGGAAR